MEVEDLEDFLESAETLEAEAVFFVEPFSDFGEALALLSFFTFSWGFCEGFSSFFPKPSPAPDKEPEPEPELEPESEPEPAEKNENEESKKEEAPDLGFDKNITLQQATPPSESSAKEEEEEEEEEEPESEEESEEDTE